MVDGGMNQFKIREWKWWNTEMKFSIAGGVIGETLCCVMAWNIHQGDESRGMDQSVEWMTGMGQWVFGMAHLECSDSPPLTNTHNHTHKRRARLQTDVHTNTDNTFPDSGNSCVNINGVNKILLLFVKGNRLHNFFPVPLNRSKEWRQ